MNQIAAQAGARPLPTTLEEITAEWLTAALRTKAPGVTVRGVEVLDMNRGTCTKIRLKLDLDEAGRAAGVPEQVILKGGFEPHSRAMGFMHEQEVRGYRDVLPVLKLPAPACYFADYDEERLQGLIVMEDLTLRGVAFCNPLVPHSFEAVARRLEVLAAFHAQTWASPDFAPGRRWGWATDTARQFLTYFDATFPPDVWKAFVDSPRGAAASVRFHSRDWMIEALKALVRLSDRLPHAMIHSDTHLGNLYVDRDGEPGFFDSLAGRAPPMLEVTYHMGGALDEADRPRWEGALVQHYLEALKANGVDAPGFDEAFFQYRCFLAYGYAVFIINESVFQKEAINTAYTARFSAAMLQHDTADLLSRIP
jgi:hypothetical protein